MSKYGHRSVNWLESVVNKLGGEDAAEAFLRGEFILKRITIKVWRKIKLGTAVKTEPGFWNATSNHMPIVNCSWGDIYRTKDFLDSVAMNEQEVELVNVSPAEIGFEDGAKRSRVQDRAFNLGLELCTAETGPQLRIQYPDQPKGESLEIQMKPIGGEDVFSVYNVNGKTFINTCIYMGPEEILSPGKRLIFKLKNRE